METKEEKWALPQGLGQALLDYLSQRPYRETYQLVEALTKLEPIKEIEGNEN